MDEAGKAFLAGAGLAEQEHGGVLGGDPLGQRQQLRTGRLPAGGATNRADQLGDQGVAERHVLKAEADAGGAVAVAERQGGGPFARIDEHVLGASRIGFADVENAGGGVGGVEGGDAVMTQPGPGQPCRQRRIGAGNRVAQSDRHCIPAHRPSPPRLPRPDRSKARANRRTCS